MGAPTCHSCREPLVTNKNVTICTHCDTPNRCTGSSCGLCAIARDRQWPTQPHPRNVPQSEEVDRWNERR